MYILNDDNDAAPHPPPSLRGKFIESCISYIYYTRRKKKPNNETFKNCFQSSLKYLTIFYRVHKSKCKNKETRLIT